MKVNWSDAAKRSYEKTVDYLEDNWGDEVVEGFRKKMRQAVKAISKMPAAAPLSKEMGVRKFVVAKYNVIDYMVLKDEIYIVALVDSRSDHPY